MAKRTNKFDTKGSLNMEEGIVYETKKVGKDEVIVPISLFDYLREFDGKNVTISITENVEIGLDIKEENDDEYEEDE